MFRNILVPVDLTEKNEAAIATAIELGHSGEAVVTLLHVIETIQGVEFDELAEFYRDLDAKAQAVMEEWVSRFEDRGARVDRTVAYGKRGAEVIRCAERLACDLVIMGSHAVPREHPGADLGTISHQVALLAGCPVLLLR